VHSVRSASRRNYELFYLRFFACSCFCSARWGRQKIGGKTKTEADSQLSRSRDSQSERLPTPFFFATGNTLENSVAELLSDNKFRLSVERHHVVTAAICWCEWHALQESSLAVIRTSEQVATPSSRCAAVRRRRQTEPVTASPIPATAGDFVEPCVAPTIHWVSRAAFRSASD